MVLARLQEFMDHDLDTLQQLLEAYVAVYMICTPLSIFYREEMRSKNEGGNGEPICSHVVASLSQ